MMYKNYDLHTLLLEKTVRIIALNSKQNILKKIWILMLLIKHN